MPGDVQQLLEERDRLLIQQKKIYKNSVSNLNMRYGALLKNDFGSTLVRNCARDAAGEVVRKYFDTSDFYVTVDALYDRIVHFSYEMNRIRLPKAKQRSGKNCIIETTIHGSARR